MTCLGLLVVGWGLQHLPRDTRRVERCQEEFLEAPKLASPGESPGIYALISCGREGFGSFMVLRGGEAQLCPTTPKLVLVLDVVLYLLFLKAKLGFVCAVVNYSHFADAPTEPLHRG